MTSPLLAAVVGHEAAQQAILDLIAELRQRGLTVGGQRQETERDASGRKMEMALVDLQSEDRFIFSQKLGKGSLSCGINEQVLSDAAQAFRRTLEQRPDLLVLNKFSHLEADGRGMRSEFAAAAASGLPLICQVPEKALPGWIAFSDGLGATLPPEMPALIDWWDNLPR